MSQGESSIVLSCERISYEARKFAAESKMNFGTALDLSDGLALVYLDRIMLVVWQNSHSALIGMKLPIGCFLGEYIRITLGGEWIIRRPYEESYLRNVGKAGISVYPFKKLERRFAGGDGESLEEYFNAISSTSLTPMKND